MGRFVPYDPNSSGGGFGITDLLDNQLVTYDTVTEELKNVAPEIIDSQFLVDLKSYDLLAGNSITLLEGWKIEAAGERMGAINIATNKSYDFVQQETTLGVNDIPLVFYSGGASLTRVQDSESTDKVQTVVDASFLVNIDPLKRIYNVIFETANIVTNGQVAIKQQGNVISLARNLNFTADQEVVLPFLLPPTIEEEISFQVDLTAEGVNTFDVKGNTSDFPFVEYDLVDVIAMDVGIFNPLLMSDGELLQYDATSGTLTPTNMIVTADEFDIGNRTLVAGV